MANNYKIRDGFSFVMDDRTVKSGGDIVTLEDDVAKSHAHKLELIDSDAKKTTGKQKADTA
jgi:hypothetical protein